MDTAYVRETHPQNSLTKLQYLLWVPETFGELWWTRCRNAVGSHVDACFTHLRRCLILTMNSGTIAGGPDKKDSNILDAQHAEKTVSKSMNAKLSLSWKCWVPTSPAALNKIVAMIAVLICICLAHRLDLSYSGLNPLKLDIHVRIIFVHIHSVDFEVMWYVTGTVQTPFYKLHHPLKCKICFEICHIERGWKGGSAAIRWNYKFWGWVVGNFFCTLEPSNWKSFPTKQVLNIPGSMWHFRWPQGWIETLIVCK